MLCNISNNTKGNLLNNKTLHLYKSKFIRN